MRKQSFGVKEYASGAEGRGPWAVVESRRETVHRLLLWLLQGVCVWGGGGWPGPEGNRTL